MIAKGMIAKGSSSIQLANVPTGAYMIRFSNGSGQYVEKFVKQ
jgi:hypothetical protein